MQAHAAPALLPGRLHEVCLGLKVEPCRVDGAAVRPAGFEQGGVDEGAGVEHEVGGFKKPVSPQGDEIGGARSRADEGNGKAPGVGLGHGAFSLPGAVFSGAW